MPGLLVPRFLLGMASNLFGTIPTRHPGTDVDDRIDVARVNPSATTHRTRPLAPHVVLGSLLVLVGFGLIVIASVLRQRRWVISSLVAALGLVAAWTTGGALLIYNQGASAMTMASGCLLALCSCAIAMYLQLGPDRRTTMDSRLLGAN